jgi:hypothetical protein
MITECEAFIEWELALKERLLLCHLICHKCHVLTFTPTWAAAVYFAIQ